MPDNELRNKLIINKLKHAIGESIEGFTLQTLLYEVNSLDGIKESELREAVNWAVRKGIITSENKENSEDSVFAFSDNVPTARWCTSERINISVTVPRSSSYSIGEIIDRNGFVSTASSFRRIISSARRTVRISSPFLQRNVTDNNSLPDLGKMILSAFQRGCSFIILSRELRSRRRTELGWIVDLARNNGFADKLKIFDYYNSKKGGELDSSTHAKLIIADEELAYIGSAELRLNSLYRNFEVGVMLEGPMVMGLTELFDTMTIIAKRVY